MKFNKSDVAKVTKIVTEHTGRLAIHNSTKDHEEQKKSRQSCCWSNPIIMDGFEIACCQPSIQSKGDTLMAFFTFKKL
jgi:hypothetical protein